MAQEEQDDDVKKRALKRVGVAIVLALVAAVGLTMLSRSNKPAPQPEPTVLPAEPAAAIEQPVSAVVQIAPEAQPASAVAETPPELDSPPTIKTPPPPPPQVINNVPQPMGEPAHRPAKPLAAKPYGMEAEVSAKPAPAASQTGKPRANQELVVTSKESVREALAKANGTPPAKPVETAKAPEPQKLAEAPKAAEKTPPPPAPAPTSQPPAKGYAVQLGVFSNPANATQMQEKLAQHGIKSYTETKLNVGPFRNKAEAEEALTKLRGLGISAVVVPLSK